MIDAWTRLSETRRKYAKGKTLDEVNEELAKKHPEAGAYLHPTKGFRHIAAIRMLAQGMMHQYPFGSPMYRGRKK